MKRLAVAFLCMVCLAASLTAGAVPYQMVDLRFGMPDHFHTVNPATGINDSGQVVGWSAVQTIAEYPPPSPVAHVWQNGTVTELGVGQPNAINNNGQIVGLYLMWYNGTITDLGISANDINDGGQIVGCSQTGAALWQNGTLTDLGPGHATSINDSGQIVGYSGNCAWLWQNGTLTNLGPGIATSINDSGQIVGYSGNRAWLWQNGTLTDLGPGHANSINNNGQIVGYSLSGFSIRQLPCIWQNGTVVNLPLWGTPGDLGYDYAGQAFDINDSGQVVGSSIGSYLERAYLWTPIPEPSSILALFCGLMGLGVSIRRRMK